MKKFVIILALGVITLLSGCAAQVQRGVSSNLISYLYPDGQRVAHANDTMPHLKLPLSVGIAFVPESKPDYTFSLTEAEKHALLNRVAGQFKNYEFIAEIEIIPEIYLRQGKGFATLSQVAALHQIDVIALVSYDQVAHSDENALSLAYWTIAGAYIIPGTTTETSTFVDTAVFDVATQKLLFRAPGMSRSKRVHALIGADAKTRKLRSEDFSLAVEQMVVNLVAELKQFQAKARQGEQVRLSYRHGFSGGGSWGLGGLGLLLAMLIFARSGRGGD